jgi:hypothetical protein
LGVLPDAASATDGPLSAAARVAVEPVLGVLRGVVLRAFSAVAAPALGLPVEPVALAVAGLAAAAFAGLADAAGFGFVAVADAVGFAGGTEVAGGVGFAAAGFGFAAAGFGFVAVGDAVGLATTGFGFAAAGFGLGFAAGFGRDAVPGFGFAAGDAVLVDERGARGSPAAGAPTERGEPEVPRRGAVVVRLAAAGVAGVAGVVGASAVVSCSPRRSRPASPAPADTASRPIPTTESMMSFGLMAMRSRLTAAGGVHTANAGAGSTAASPHAMASASEALM